MCLSIAVNHPDCVLAKGKHAGHEWNVVHNGRQHRCGYVKVEVGHPWHGEDYNDIRANVHGGLTFSAADIPCGKEGPDSGYWFGFDCAHYGDAPDPALPNECASMIRTFREGMVRTQEYVETECRNLCEQARAAAK